MLKVTHANICDLEEILNIYATARKYMMENGNPNQWGTTHPAESLIKDDVLNNRCMIIKDENTIQGVFALYSGIDPTYVKIEGSWLNYKPYHTIHRIASKGEVKGVFKAALDYTIKLGLDIRIDTHRDNLTMQYTLKKYGFIYCGIIKVADRTERLAYQLIA